MNNSIDNIKRNDNNFKFVDTLGEFINNIQFKRGYNEYELRKNNQYSYLWNALSAIGEEYADIIYDNVLNYLDNVSNVDLCKIKALQSMINIVGLQYDVLDSFKTIPVEIANLMDILSINRSYILQSSKFSEAFIDLLSTEGVIQHSNLEDKTKLSTEISATYNVKIYNDYIDEDGYKRFLLKTYQFILNKYVKLQYADTENDLSSKHQFIYEYIQNDILTNQNIGLQNDLTDYQKKMSQLKIKYGINKSFDQSTIVDNIENGYDSIENYNTYEQELIKEEILYREQTYSYVKTYRTAEEKFLGYNLTRYSYYREKKVKEYFSYIENTYNNMIIESNIRSIIDNTSNDKILVYDKDHNYFDIKQDNRETLLKYDPTTKNVYLQTNQINAIAQLLVEQTLEIADIRDQIKVQIRKSYMRGTFLLISYVINEFLKYGIQKKYGDYFSTDEGLTLGDILSASFNIDNVQLIEYYDNTEYFNITTQYDVSALNPETVNDKFWDNFYNKIGVNTQDIPLDEIENFYLNQLKLKHNKVDDVVNFLSIIYEYGANNSFIGRKTGEFTCKLHDGRLIGEPQREISNIKNEILSIETINDAIDTYVERGYVLSVTEISSQLSTLTDFVSSYYWTEISNANESLKEETFSNYEINLATFNTIADSLNEISVRYDELKDNSKYRYYIDDYGEPTDQKPFFIEKVQNFIASCDHEFIWTNVDLSLDLTALLDKYNRLSGDLYNKLFALSVWNTHWQYYSPNYDDELTTVTNALKDFLINQAQIQTHDDNIINQIKAINLSTARAYNISWINNEFNKINLSVQQLMLDDPDYFENYSHNATDRLDNQITSISNYMITQDKQAKEDVLSAINNISIDYNTQLIEFDSQMPTVKRDIVESIQDNYAYNVNYILYSDEIYSDISDYTPHPPYPPTIRYKKCLDYLLSGNYLDIGYDKNKQLSGILNWIEICAYNGFENTAVSAIHNKIPQLKDYIDMINLIDLAKQKYLYDSLNEIMLIPDKLDEIISGLNYDISYISSQIPHYNAQKEIYLKYNGTQIGYDPFYNYKNLAYSSYQIHPYLYNFVEKSNLIYPLANNFFVSFTETYEKDLYKKTIDTIIGKYGNIKDLWRSGMFDWTGYQSLYEKRGSLFAETSKNPIIGFTGLFYPPALEAFLSDPETFMQDTQDDVISSYYHHLNLGIDASNRIVDQLTAYYNAIKELVQFNSSQASLSNEYDIYKYAEDVNGNSLFLLKSYKHLYIEHADEENYVPSYNEKKNTLGELWMRIKDHPLAFPAFDIRSGNESISQYNVEENHISNGKPINQYLFDISEYFSTCSDNIQNYTIDLVSSTDIWTRQKQYLKCFFDFELSPSHRSILLNVPYKTGTNSKKIMLSNTKNKISNVKSFRYANSSILVAYLEDAGLDNSGIHIYNFTSQYTTTDDINVNIDNIANPSMLIGDNLAASIDSTNTNSSDFYEFIGFASNTQYIYAVFAQKSGYMPINSYNQNALYHSFKVINKNNYIPYLRLRVTAYRLGSRLITSTIASDALKYDIYNAHRDFNIKQRDVESYINASNVVLASNNNTVTIAFLTERISPAKNNKYLNTSTIVNFSEYSQMTEKYTVIDESGIDKNYPTSTALIQTTDSDRINIYNSFDSFVQHLVNVTFEYNGNRLRYKNTKYFNLNSDIGYLPQYPDTFGKNNLFNNIALSGKNEYAIELLGPEKSDIPFTPIIKDNTDEKYGRVVEDYKEFNKIIGYNDDDLYIPENTRTYAYKFELSTMFPDDEWSTLTATPDLLRYKYILYNTKYEARPLAKGNLSDDLPNGYYYQWEEKYDLLSGEELIGPNQMSYQNVAMTNHIDNISALPLSVEFDTDTLLPINVHLSCVVRTLVNSEQRIPANTFRLMVYVKNNVKSYEYYHLFENASMNAIHDSISYDEEWRINYNEISSLSDYIVPGTTKKPFENKSSDISNPRKLSAMLEFKYSENENINREFPYLDASDVEDEIIIVQNDTQSIYYTALDNNKSIDRGTIKIDVYDPDSNDYITRTLITSLPKYNDFYDKSLRIETTYNLEKVNADNPDSEYEIVMYFNYKNFTNPSYIKFIKQDNDAPIGIVYDSTDEEIQHTYLALKPGESGKLDIRIDYVYYAKINPEDISESIVGCYSQTIKTYYIMNISDDKPKFILSRSPFGANQSYALETDNYELKDTYQLGMPFRYIMLIVVSTRMHPMTTAIATNSIVAIGKIKFKTKDNEYFNYPSDTTAYIEGAGATIIQPNVPSRMLDTDDQHYFSASNCDFDASPLSIVIDLHESILDVQQYKYWEWYNSPYSNSHSGYMPDEFKIAFSNDKHRWYLGDSVDDVQKILPTTNYRKAYPYGSWTGELHIDE